MAAAPREWRQPLQLARELLPLPLRSRIFEPVLHLVAIALGTWLASGVE